MTRAISLYSGGLDSTLATIIVMYQGIEVIAINFEHPFSCKRKNPDSIAKNFSFELKYFPLGDKFLEIVKNPKFGYGKNMNPCIDCRILMLKEVKKLMKELGAEFIITGEVLGQRPMSQHISALKSIEKETELEGIILRPLSAKLLPETIPEKKGLVDRSKLFDFKGKTRKPQFDLARKFGLNDIPQPGGGCLLTDPVYSMRLKDLLRYKEPDIRDIELLKIGRHFRVSEKTKLIIGRNYDENCQLEKFYQKGDILLTPADDIPGPSALIVKNENDKNISEEDIEFVAGICAYYSDNKSGKVIIKVSSENLNMIFEVQPVEKYKIDRVRIQ